MSENENEARIDSSQYPEYNLPGRVEHVRNLFLQAVEPLAEDLNSDEVLNLLKISFKAGFEALALKSEGVQEGMAIAHHMQQQAQQQMQRAQQMQAQQPNGTQVPQKPSQDEKPHGLYL